MAYSRSERQDHQHTRPKRKDLQIKKLGKFDMKEFEKNYGRGGPKDGKAYQRWLRQQREIELDNQADTVRYEKAKEGKKLLNKRLYRGSDLY